MQKMAKTTKTRTCNFFANIVVSRKIVLLKTVTKKVLAVNILCTVAKECGF